MDRGRQVGGEDDETELPSVPRLGHLEIVTARYCDGRHPVMATLGITVGTMSPSVGVDRQVKTFRHLFDND